MRAHLQRDLDKLKKKLLGIGGMVEDAVKNAMTALQDRRLDLAQEVIAGDKEVDRIEVEFEEDCLKFLALHAPVAQDLRVAVAFLKVNNDLERVGDLAQNIAERAASLATQEPIAIPDRLLELADRVRAMLRGCLDSVVNLDTAKAREMLREDEAVDAIHASFYQYVNEKLDERAAPASDLLQILSVSRYLERIADQATNIAEDVVFVVDAEVIRHQS